jgi:hypothetical protein
MERLFAGPALITLAAIGLLFGCIWYVGWARGRYGIAAPATTGHRQFEIAYRIQMNTLENVVAFLPLLWLFAAYLEARWATALGVMWLAGRIWYAVGYARDPRLRGRGYLVSMLAFGALGVGATIGVVRAVI